MRTWVRFCECLRDERGATAIEYVFICALIFLVIIGSIGATGSGIGGRWTNMANNAAANMQKY